MGAEYSIPKVSKCSSNSIKSPSKSARPSRKGSSECPTQEFAQKTKIGPNVSAKRQSRNALNNNVSSNKSTKPGKTIFIEAENGKRLKIQVDIDRQDGFTCEWLLNEAKQVLGQNDLLNMEEDRPLVALQTIDHNITLDYWLTCPKKSISVLNDKIVLRPFYGDNKYKIGEQKVNLKFFHFVKLLGSGGFSKVYLMRRKDNGKLYALKAISKEELSDEDKKQAIVNERNIFVRLHHPFLTKLHFAFQTVTHLFFVMDFFPGGDLFYHLTQRKKFTEDQVKIYVGEIILALNYLHKNNIIYRDIKPENILVDIDGHLHLSDFGLCKPLKDKSDMNYTFCGSPEYLAPEMIQNKGYSFPVDHYGLGILIYELVVGRAPFHTSSHGDLLDQIVTKKVQFPSGMSANLQSLLAMLLVKNPRKRLGAKGGFTEIISHPWCQQIDLTKIAKKKGTPPIVPSLYQTNFDKGFIEREITLEDESSVIESPEFRDYVKSIEDKPSLFANQKLSADPFKDFSFYSNIDDPYDKYLDSILASDKDDSEDLDAVQYSKMNKSDGEIEIKGQSELIYQSAFKSEKTSHGIVPKFKLPISQVCQENYEEEPLEGPFSAKELTSYTTLPIKPLRETGRVPIPTITQTPTQTSIVLNERAKGKHKATLSCDASFKDFKYPVPSTAGSSLHLVLSGVCSTKSVSNCKETTGRQRTDRPPENGIQTEKTNESLIFDEFEGNAVHPYSSVKELPRLGGVKKTNQLCHTLRLDALILLLSFPWKSLL